MKLSECKYGVLVVRNIPRLKDMTGMVVGVGQNIQKEPIPLVQWQDGETDTIHHAHLEELKDVEDKESTE